jgi:hypothetical protein
VSERTWRRAVIVDGQRGGEPGTTGEVRIPTSNAPLVRVKGVSTPAVLMQVPVPEKEPEA